jgi:hypothetical protein
VRIVVPVLFGESYEDKKTHNCHFPGIAYLQPQRAFRWAATMAEVNTSKIRRTGPWSESEFAVMRGTLAAGGTVREVAAALGRSRKAAESAASAAGLRSMRNIPKPTQARIRDLVAEGWAPTRIARRLRVTVDVVAFFSKTPA